MIIVPGCKDSANEWSAGRRVCGFSPRAFPGAACPGGSPRVRGARPGRPVVAPAVAPGQLRPVMCPSA